MKSGISAKRYKLRCSSHLHLPSYTHRALFSLVVHFLTTDSDSKMAQSNGHVNGVSQNDSSKSDSSDTYAVPLIIGGKDVLGGRTFTVQNPAGGECWKAAGASAEDARNAVEAAQAALPAWAKTKPAARRDMFLRAADIFAKRHSEFARIQKQETGADDMFMDWILKLTVDNLKEVAGKCSAVVGSIPHSDEVGRGAFVLKEPYGVILGIAPW